MDLKALLLSLSIVMGSTQTNLPFDFTMKNIYQGHQVNIDLVASYEITGQVGVIEYKDDIRSFYNPVDVTILTGDLNIWNSTVYQHGRYATLWTRENVTHEYIISNFTNNHLIPLNDDVARDISTIERGDVVTITGHLVDTTFERDGGRYATKTSLVRNDSGDGGCEMILVSKVKIYKWSYIQSKAITQNQ